MYTNQQRILYAKQLKRLHELYVVKSNIHLTYKYKNQNKAIHNAQSLQDKIINAIIDDAVYGNADKIRNIDSTIEELMTTTLENERKRIHHKSDRYVDRAVELNAEKYSQILSNRINTEAIKLQQKIESEMASGIHNGLSEAQTRQALKEKYSNTAKARIKNIIKDSVHTNESNISWINALNEGYSYKVWMNGQGKGKVRRWHRASIIAPVPIDEYFDLHGSYPAQAMYPGDLYAGAENVANCRCWLRYTNRRPERLGQKQTVFNIPQTSYLNPSNNTSKNIFGEGVKVKPIETIKTTISNTTKKVTNKIKKITQNFTTKIDSKKHSPQTKVKSTYDRDKFPQKLEKPTPKSNTQIKTSKNNPTLDVNSKNNHPTYIYKDVSIIRGYHLFAVPIITKLYDDLPNNLKKYITEIRLCPEKLKNNQKVAGDTKQNSTTINLYYISGHDYAPTVIHEAAHVWDYNSGEKTYNLSNSPFWKIAFILDEIHKIIHGKYGHKGYVSEYAMSKGEKYKQDASQNDRIYAEDFADSVKFYQTNKTNFKNNNPNRSRLLYLWGGF